MRRIRGGAARGAASKRYADGPTAGARYPAASAWTGRRDWYSATGVEDGLDLRVHLYRARGQAICRVPARGRDRGGGRPVESTGTPGRSGTHELTFAGLFPTSRGHRAPRSSPGCTPRLRTRASAVELLPPTSGVGQRLDDPAFKPGSPEARRQHRRLPELRARRRRGGAADPLGAAGRRGRRWRESTARPIPTRSPTALGRARPRRHTPTTST